MIAERPLEGFMKSLIEEERTPFTPGTRPFESKALRCQSGEEMVRFQAGESSINLYALYTVLTACRMSHVYFFGAQSFFGAIKCLAAAPGRRLGGPAHEALPFTFREDAKRRAPSAAKKTG